MYAVFQTILAEDVSLIHAVFRTLMAEDVAFLNKYRKMS